MDEPYKNREIDAMFDSLRTELLDEKFGILPRIEAQTKKTNGRVTRLERTMLVVVTVLVVIVATNNPEVSRLLVAVGL